MDQKLMPRVAAVMAHPDDAELNCFGTLLKYAEHGYQINVIIVCTGERGISVVDQQNHGIERLHHSMRFQESVRAFAGTSIMLECLGYEDGQLALNRELIAAIETKLREIQPTILITHFSCFTGADHQDHQVVGQACINASLRCPFIKSLLQVETLQPIRSEFVPNYFVNITPYFDRKMLALAQHTSQAGRAYLTKEYHLTKCQNNALAVNAEFHAKGLLFESFYNRITVEL